MRRSLLVLLALPVVGCVNFEDEAQRGYSRTGGFAVQAAFTTADSRIITERRHPVTGDIVVCTEPSPDVAKALSTAFAASGQGGNGSASGNLALSASSAEAVAELAGRSTALLGLRDGLYRACEAYANGAIGADAYALVLSRYGQLMTTLFLGQDIVSATTAAAKAQSPSVTAAASTTGSSTSPAVSAMTTTAAPTATPAAADGTPSAPATGAAAALARMNEDYFNLDYDFPHLLAVACINASDPTRAPPANNVYANGAPVRNEVLVALCAKVTPLTVQALAQLSPSVAIQLAQGHILVPPVDPMTMTPAATPPKSAPSKPAPTATTCVTMDDQQTAMVEGELEYQKLLTAPDPGKSVDPAVLASGLMQFENKQTPPIKDPSCKPGQIGSKTLTAFETLLADHPTKKAK
jgi:hypothetical protein